MKLISDRPSDPFLLNAWANEISSLLGETETTLIELLTRTIRKNKGASSWQTLKLAQTARLHACLLYTSPSPRDVEESRMPSSA